MFTDLLRLVEQENRKTYQDWFAAAAEYKASWEQELDERKRTGRKGPEPLPHPDDIAIDLRAGTVAIRGPMTKEEKPDGTGFVSSRRISISRSRTSKSS
jgi:hypothetical protein